jgi:hypothetical protein
MKILLVSVAALVCAYTVNAQTRVDLQTQGKGILSDCAFARTGATVLTSGSCTFSFPNQSKVSLSGVTITITGGSGTAFIYADVDGAIHVGHSATLAIACHQCMDAGPMVIFPTDAIRIGTWPASSGVWDTTGQTDDRVFLRGALRLTPGPGVVISDSGVEKQISADTAIMQTKIAAQAGQEILCAGSPSATAQTCALLPTLTAYTPGMRVRWMSGETNMDGALTLNIDSLGAIPVKKADGSSDPAAGELPPDSTTT